METMQEDLSPGTVVAGRYVIEYRARRRPLANAYTAHLPDQPDGRFHVWQIKGVRASDPEVIQGFLKAMERVRGLSNASIPAIVAEDVLGTGPLVITARVALPTLRERIAGGLRLTRPDVIHLVRAVASVIDELHGCEPPVVHRALAPDDIVLGDHEGQCWVECCGFAHAIAVSGMAGRVTPSFVEVPYRSPDELNATVEPRTDLFVLASIVFECLTGERAFQGDDTAEVANAILHGARPSVCALRPELSPEVDPILVRAWMTDFTNGYATAWSFARDLTEALSAIPSARARAKRATRPAAPALNPSLRPSLADMPEENSVVMPAPEVRARMPQSLPDEAELDRAFDNMMGPDESPRDSGVQFSIPAPRRVDIDDDDAKPTQVISAKDIPRPSRMPDPLPPASLFAPGPPVRAPTPGRGTGTGIRINADEGVFRPVTRPSVHGPPPRPSAHPPQMSEAPPPTRRSVPPPPPSVHEMGQRSAVRAPTPGSGGVVLRGQTPVTFVQRPGGGTLRPPTPVPTGRLVDVPVGNAPPPHVESALARSSIRTAPMPELSAPAPDAPTSFPNANRPAVKLMSRPPDEPSPVQREAGVQNRAAWIVAIAMVAAAAIIAVGQYQVRRVESENARPILAVPRRGAGSSANNGGMPMPGEPDPADVSAVRSRLESVVRLCLAHGAPGRRIHFSVRYMGASGHASDVQIDEPFAHIPAADCVDRAARTIDLPAFTARDYTADYSIDLE